MRVSITNNARAGRSVYGLAGRVFIDAGKTVTADISKAEYDSNSTRLLPGGGGPEFTMQVIESEGPAAGGGIKGAAAFDHDGDGRVGGSKKKTPEGGEGDTEAAPDLDAMTKAELINYIGEKGGEAAMSSSKAELLEAAKAL